MTLRRVIGKSTDWHSDCGIRCKLESPELAEPRDIVGRLSEVGKATVADLFEVGFSGRLEAWALRFALVNAAAFRARRARLQYFNALAEPQRMYLSSPPVWKFGSRSWKPNLQ